MQSSKTPQYSAQANAQHGRPACTSQPDQLHPGRRTVGLCRCRTSIRRVVRMLNKRHESAIALRRGVLFVDRRLWFEAGGRREPAMNV